MQYYERSNTSISRSETKRDKILRGAAQLFTEKSYLGTSVDELASKLKLNKASIYYYFKDKEHLLYEVGCRAIEDLIKKANAIATTDASPMEKMESLVKLHLETGADLSNFWGVPHRELRQLSSKLFKSYVVYRDKYEQIFRDLMREGIANGQIKDCEPCLKVRFILGLVNSVSIWYKRTGPLTIGQIGDEMWKFISHSL